MMLLFFFYMHPEDLRRPQLNVSNENVQMLCPCFTPVKVSPRSLHGLPTACQGTRKEQRGTWPGLHTFHLSACQQTTMISISILNVIRIRESGQKTECVQVHTGLIAGASGRTVVFHSKVLLCAPSASTSFSSSSSPSSI